MRIFTQFNLSTKWHNTGNTLHNTALMVFFFKYSNHVRRTERNCRHGRDVRKVHARIRIPIRSHTLCRRTTLILIYAAESEAIELRAVMVLSNSVAPVLEFLCSLFVSASLRFIYPTCPCPMFPLRHINHTYTIRVHAIKRLWWVGVASSLACVCARACVRTLPSLTLCSMLPSASLCMSLAVVALCVAIAAVHTFHPTAQMSVYICSLSGKHAAHAAHFAAAAHSAER